MKFKRWITVLVVMVFFVQGLSGTALALTVDEIGNKLLCTCGCQDPSLTACDCQVADTMRGEISEQIDAGKGEADIITFMRGKYGNEITNAPDKSGFDLTAWLMPFAVVFAGSVGVVKVMSNWIKKGKGKDDDGDHTDDGDGGPDDGVDDGVDDRVESELKEFGW